MSEETKDKGKFEIPMVPIFGVDLGERLGSLAEGQRRMDARIDKIESRLDAMDAKFEAKTDTMAYALNRLDERTKSMQNQIMVIGGAILAAVIAGIVVQFFLK